MKMEGEGLPGRNSRDLRLVSLKSDAHFESDQRTAQTTRDLRRRPPHLCFQTVGSTISYSTTRPVVNYDLAPTRDILFSNIELRSLSSCRPPSHFHEFMNENPSFGTTTNGCVTALDLIFLQGTGLKLK